MALRKADKEFRLSKISYLDFKHLEMDRVLTSLFMRIRHNGFPSRLVRKRDLTIDEFTNEFLEHPEWFEEFSNYPEIVKRWIETHLMDVVNRGKDNQAVAAPRPLHGYTYKFRNPKHSRDYGAAQHVYEMLYFARQNRTGNALDHLKKFFFPAVDPNTEKYDPDVPVDVETQALLRLADQVELDRQDNKGREGPYPPICIGSADLMADDVIRLLVYRNHMPRSVMVEYLKILISFHLALYHIRLLKLLPALVRRKDDDPICAASRCPMTPRSDKDPQGDCPYRIGLLLDVANRPGTPMAMLAERSADLHYRRIPGFIKAYFLIKKLDECADNLRTTGKLSMPPQGFFSVGDLARLLKPQHETAVSQFFGMRLAGLFEAIADDESGLDPQVQAIVDLKLPDMDTYVESIVAFRGAFHRQYITESLDSLLLKNRPGAMITQPRTKNAPRRFVLDSRALEVLLQLAVLRLEGQKFRTVEVRIEEILTFLRDRYGLYIDQLPRGDGFGDASIEDREALRTNIQAFRDKLREVGFYRDLSDAYVSQTVSPRYTIDDSDSPEEAGQAGGQQ